MMLCPLISGGNWTAALRSSCAWRRRMPSAVLSGGIFVALVFAGLQGVLINCLTGRAFRRVSPWVQMASMAFLITILFLTPLLAGSIRPLFEQHSPLLRWFPPFWFLALVHGPASRAARRRVIPRHRAARDAGGRVRRLRVRGDLLRRILAARAAHHGKRGDHGRSARAGCGAAFDRLVNAHLLPHPLERATFHFISSTILRSARHRLFLATYGGIAIALALPNLAWLGTRPGAPSVVFTAAGLLPVPLILTFLCVTGLRGAFNLPAELRANWVFQTAESEERVPHIRAARKWIVTMGLAPLLLALLPVRNRFPRMVGRDPLTFALALALVLLNVAAGLVPQDPVHVLVLPGQDEHGRHGAGVRPRATCSM